MKKGRKQERREQAIDRQKVYDSLTLAEKLSIISARIGNSKKEVTRLNEQSNKKEEIR